jgi:precorrin-3B synthase
VPTPGFRRADADACPGALRLHSAADGPLARIRLPGGLLTGAQLSALRELAQEFGDGHIELTSRANLQLRALTTAPPDVLEGRLHAAGLLPSATHELVRNIMASPLPHSQRQRAQVQELDHSLCAAPRLAALPGRFLFAIDGGALDVARTADVAAVPEPDQDHPNGVRVESPEFAILIAGLDLGLRVPAGRVVDALLAAAHAFLDERDGQLDADRGGSARPAWRVRELVNGPARVAARAAGALGMRLGEGRPLPDPVLREPIGILGEPGMPVALGAVVPLGRVSGVQMRVLSEAAAIVVTPWRGMVLPDLPLAAAQAWQGALAEAGLEVRSGSRWSGVTSCAGRPGCAKSLADVRSDAAAATMAGAESDRAELLPVHWVGCARGCGSPAGPHVRAEATGSGYQVRAGGFSGFATAEEAAAVVAAARRS